MKSAPLRRLRRSLISLLVWPVLLLLFVWSLRTVTLAAVWNALTRVETTALLALAGLNVIIFLLFNIRWWLILRALNRPVPFMALNGYRLAAFAISYFTPGGQFGGEPFQVYLLRARNGLPGAQAIAAVTLDRLFELLANFTFLMIGILLILNGGWLSGFTQPPALLAAFGLVLLPLVYLACLWAGRFPFSWLLRRAGRWGRPESRAGRMIRRLHQLAAPAERQIAALLRQRPAAVVASLLLSGLVWVLLLGEYWLMLYFLGLRLDLGSAIIALTAARLAFLTPLPAGLGALEAGQILAMQALGAPAEVGLSASLLIRLRDLITGGLGLWLVGYFSRAKSGISLQGEAEHLPHDPGPAPALPASPGEANS